MKRLLLMVVAFFFITTITKAEEEGTPNDQTVLNAQIPCNTWDVITTNIVHEYEEVPVAGGTSALTMPDGQVFGGDLVIFINPNTLTYTTVIHFESENLGCIVGAGEKFGPVVEKYLELYGAVRM